MKAGSVVTDATTTTAPEAHAAARPMPIAWLRRLRWPSGEAAARLTLLGLVVALQNLIELPRPLFRDHLGRPLTGLLIVLATGGSLALLLLALRTPLPRWCWPRARWVQIGVLALTLAAIPTGVRQVGVMLAAGFQPPSYPNDGTTLDHYAAQQVLEGHNPYTTVDIIAAVRLYHQVAEHTTPLGQGAFAGLYPNSYPTQQQMERVFAAEPAGHPAQVREFESHVSYPALAFLPLVPLVWAGIPSVVPFFVACMLALAALIILAAPPTLRPWLGLLALADAPLLDATVAGDLDVFYILLLFVAWRWWRRPILSTVFLGLAIAAKQIAWFFLPFYLLLVARDYGWREAGKRLAGAAAFFAVLNAPFFLNDPRGYVAGVLAPQVDRMFPAGTGLVQLSTQGLLPLPPAAVYTALYLGGFVACVAWYWRVGRRKMPEAGFVLAVLPLFFAWRSLTTYFYFVALPAAALLLARLREGAPKASGRAFRRPMGGDVAAAVAVQAPTTSALRRRATRPTPGRRR
jgi:hypothetical protein